MEAHPRLQPPVVKYIIPLGVIVVDVHCMGFQLGLEGWPRYVDKPDKESVLLDPIVTEWSEK